MWDSVSEFCCFVSMTDEWCALIISEYGWWEWVFIYFWFPLYFDINRYNFTQFHIPQEHPNFSHIIIQFPQIMHVHTLASPSIKIAFPFQYLLFCSIYPSSASFVQFSSSEYSILEYFIMRLLCWYCIVVIGMLQAIWFLIEN